MTGSQWAAGTTGSVFLNLIGRIAQTEKLQVQNLLDVIFRKRLSKRSSKTFVVVSKKDLGDILVVKIGCKAAVIQDDWYVNFVAVGNLQTSTVERFPCYHWLGRNSNISITASTSK